MRSNAPEGFVVDERRLTESFARVAAYGDEVALFFYSHLFLSHPEVRDMFPVSMVNQRDRLLNALGRIVADVGRLDELVPFLQDLGREHRKFGTLADHYPAVGNSLIATLAHFSGDAWNEELAADWTAAYTLVAKVMVDAAAGDTRPPWWDAQVVGYERRSADVAVIRVAFSEQLRYAPGQSVAIETELRPRLWRFYSPANAPREDASMDFHIRMVDGGQVSLALGLNPRLGTRLRVGPPTGTFTLGKRSGRELLLAAGGTGLAPFKGMLEQLSAEANPPRVHLVFGARSGAELYDLADLEKMAAHWPWFTMTAAASDDPGFSGERGTVAEVIARQGAWVNRDVYVCGSSAMVTGTVDYLRSLGAPAEHIFVEDFGWE